jgi:hypothetical protein
LDTTRHGRGENRSFLLIIDTVVDLAASVRHGILLHHLRCGTCEHERMESTSMTIFDRFNIGLIGAVAGLCGLAVALSAGVAAAPLLTGGQDCMETSAGDVGGAAPLAAGCPAAAPIADMAGIPMALPGPVPVPAAPVPLGAPLPVGAPVPLGAPIPAAAPLPVAAPIAAGAPLVDMAGGYGGKGDPILPPASGAPVSGQPILPGPGAS